MMWELLNVSRLKQIREMNEEITKSWINLVAYDVITTITNISTFHWILYMASKLFSQFLKSFNKNLSFDLTWHSIYHIHNIRDSQSLSYVFLYFYPYSDSTVVFVQKIHNFFSGDFSVWTTELCLNRGAIFWTVFFGTG